MADVRVMMSAGAPSGISAVCHRSITQNREVTMTLEVEGASFVIEGTLNVDSGPRPDHRIQIGPLDV